MRRMKLTIITPTYTHQRAATLRAEGSWEECAKLLSDEHLEMAAYTKGWIEEFIIPLVDEDPPIMATWVRRQETVTRDGVKVILELDPPPPLP